MAEHDLDSRDLSDAHLEARYEQAVQATVTDFVSTLEGWAEDSEWSLSEHLPYSELHEHFDPNALLDDCASDAVAEAGLPPMEGQDWLDFLNACSAAYDEFVGALGTVTAPPYTAQRCPLCEVWVYIADGPFAEDGDPTKPFADFLHMEREHPEHVTTLGTAPSGATATSIPFFTFNEEEVQAQRIPWQLSEVLGASFPNAEPLHGHGLDSAIIPWADGYLVATAENDALVLLGIYEASAWQECVGLVCYLEVDRSRIEQVVDALTEPPEGVDWSAWAQQWAQDQLDGSMEVL